MSISWDEQLKIIPSDSGINQMGYSVSIDGNYAIIGGRYSDDMGSYAGSAFIVKKNSDETWSQQIKLFPSDSNNYDEFAKSVSISGDYAIVSSKNKVGGGNGGAYIFKKNSDETWTQQSKIISSDLAASDEFAYSVSISGNYAIVGSVADDIRSDDNAGTAYIFKKNDIGETWHQQIRILPSDVSTQNGTFFGISVAISGNYAIIGAPNQESINIINSGAAYIFKKSDSDETWSEQIKLVASDLAASDYFGHAVHIDGNYAIVGAYGNDDSYSQSGSAYIFKKSDSDETWSQTAKLVATDPGENDRFGNIAVSIYGNYAVVGSHQDQDGGSTSGSAYIFKKSDTDETWHQNAKLLASDIGTGDRFGYGVSISGNYVIVGAYGNNESATSELDAGSAYIYKLSGDDNSTSNGGSSGSSSGSSGSSGSSDAADADLTGISAADITTLESVTITADLVDSTKATIDTTVSAKIKSLVASATGATKRKHRRAALKKIFAQSSTTKKLVISKEDLGLPSTFTKTDAIVVKPGETFDISDLGSEEGFYSVLNDGESVSITLTNVTVTFTRSDVGDDELYEVSLGTGESFDDIVINTDNVNGGDFSASNTTGTLQPDDMVIIDGRRFFIGSVGDGGAAGSVADPYVYPIKATAPVKLPNKTAVYRMFEQGNNYINVLVDRATMEHQGRMFNYARNITPITHNIVMDGYFYQKAFISAEGHKMTIDYATKKAVCDEAAMDFFTIKNVEKSFDCGEFTETCKCYQITWKTAENKKISTEVMFFNNPHIENGINVVPETIKHSTGLIVDNYKPKMMQLKKLTQESCGKVWKNMSKRNIHQNKAIKGKNEKWHFN